MSTFDLDAMLDGVVMEAQLAGGRDPALVAAAFGASRAIAAVRAGGRGAASTTADRWTPEERDFLDRYAGVLGDDEIADRLGRTRTAVRVRRRRRDLPGPLVHPHYITGHQIARALGIDGHMAVDMIERGILTAEVTPLAGRHVWRMKRAAFVAWAVNPMNWPYFWRSVRNPGRLGDETLRRLILRRKAEWGDEWLTPGEVAAIHGVHHTDVNRYVNAGRLKGVKWGNWLIRRSEATAPGVRFYRGRGAGVLERAGTARGDAFLILATAVGIPYAQVSRMVDHEGHAYVQGRVLALHKNGYTPWLIRSFGLPVLYRPSDSPRDHALWADWRPLSHRFPLLARSWARWEAGEPWGRYDMTEHNLVNGVLKAAVRWNMVDGQGVATDEGKRLLHELNYRVKAAEEEVRPLWREWVAAASPPASFRRVWKLAEVGG